MLLKAKSIIKDSFWILEDNDLKVGTMRKGSDRWQVLLEQSKQEFKNYSDVISFLGTDPLKINKKKELEEPVSGKFDVNGYPTEIKPYNIEMMSHLPTYTKTLSQRYAIVQDTIALNSQKVGYLRLTPNYQH